MGLLLLLRIKLVIEGETDIVVEERGAALDAGGGGDIAVVAGIAVEEVFGIENKAGLVLQELVADAGIAQESVGVHRVGHVAAVDEEVGNELKFPSLQFVAKGECGPVVVDVLPWLLSFLLFCTIISISPY